MLAYRGGSAVADQVLATVKSYVRAHAWDTISRVAIDASPIDRLTLTALATQMAPRTVEAALKLRKQHRKLKRELGWFSDAGEKNTNEGRPPLWEHLRDQLNAAYQSQGADEDEVEVA